MKNFIEGWLFDLGFPMPYFSKAHLDLVHFQLIKYENIHLFFPNEMDSRSRLFS